MNHAILQDFALFCCSCFAAIQALLLTNTPMFGVHHSVDSDPPLACWFTFVHLFQATAVCRLSSLVLINLYSNPGVLVVSLSPAFQLVSREDHLLSADLHISNDAFN